MKKIVLLLAMVLEVTNIFGFEVDGLMYNVTSESNATVEVTQKDYRGNYRGDIVISEKVKYNGKTYKVTRIGDNAFYNCMFLTSIVIPKTIESVGKYAFYNCYRIASVTIYCKTVGRWFGHSNSLKSVVLGNGVETIENDAFMRSGITSLSLSNTITSIGDYAFAQCALTSLSIPKSVKSIGKGAFSVCTNLKNLTISNGVVRIEAYAFAECRELRRVTIPPSVTFIGFCAFNNADLIDINVPASIKELDRRGAFDTRVQDRIFLYKVTNETVFEENQEQSTGTVTELADKVDVLPTYVGGQEALVRWLQANLRYPGICLEHGVMGTVVVSFVVEVDGTLRDIGIQERVDPTLDKEALRLVRIMPKWNPAKLNGKSVAKKIALKIPFKITYE